MPRKNPLLHHVDNLMPLCHVCHQNHHTTAHKRVPLEALTEPERVFLWEHASIGWHEKWYRPMETT